MLPTPIPLEEILYTLKREKVGVEIENKFYRGILVYVGVRDESKSFMTIKCPMLGNVRILFKDVKRVWHKSKIIWRVKKIKLPSTS
jgi:hypothetical protein